MALVTKVFLAVVASDTFLNEKSHIFSAMFIFLAFIVLFVYQCFSQGGKRKLKTFSKRYVTDSDYHKMCKSQTHLWKGIKNAKAENNKLRADNAKQQESQLKLKQSLEEVSSKLKARLETKDRHIAHLTRRCAKLESALCAEANLKEKLVKEKEKATRLERENEEVKERVADLECTLTARRHDSMSLEEELNDSRLLLEKLSKERDAEAKRANQLEAQLKEAQEAKDRLLEVDHLKFPVLSLGAVSPSDFVCIRQSYRDTTGEEKTDACDQSVFGDTISPPEDYMGRNSQLVVSNNWIQEGPYNSFVGESDRVTQGYPSEVSCDSDDRENVPLSIYSAAANYVMVAPVVHSPPV